ncbi:hypothetical protein KIN20_004231 [Parelaphostrongylus tenuis]|uniref:Uncharacterized protein n=1 Tax=Parelaphostrongylus tenuis TaxID=148309 RepID=A0AAD5QEA6_PARTN|nr:hypothetical protein KIN20_004231 [Parelaphostrongylus tenuis]
MYAYNNTRESVNEIILLTNLSNTMFLNYVLSVAKNLSSENMLGRKWKNKMLLLECLMRSGNHRRHQEYSQKHAQPKSKYINLKIIEKTFYCQRSSLCSAYITNQKKQVIA